MPTANELTAKLRFLDIEIETLEQTLKMHKEQRRQLVEHDLPQALRQMQAQSIETEVGNRLYRVALRNKIVGSLSRAPDQDAALAYLEELGFTGATNATVSVTVPDSERTEIVETLADHGQAPKVERKIHPQTLASFAREKLAEGAGFDFDKVGLTILTEATIKEKD